MQSRRSLRNTFGWIWALQGPQQFHGGVKLQRICILRYLNPGLILPNNTWMITHSFLSIAVQSHKKIPKVQNFHFSSFLSEKKCVCSIVLVGGSFSNLKGKQLRVTDQCQDRPSTLQHLSDFSKHVLFFYNFMGTASFNPIRPGLFSCSPGPGGGLRGPDAKNQG